MHPPLTSRSLRVLSVLLVAAGALPAQRIGGGLDTTATWKGPIDDALYGEAIALLDDLDGDGLPDFGIGAEEAYQGGALSLAGYAEIRSSGSGAILASYSGAAFGQRLGAAIESVGDLTGDGVEEYAIGSPSAWNLGTGEVVVRNGATHAVHMTVSGPASAASFGDRIVALGDTNADGMADFAVGALRASTSGLTFNGGVYLISGASGAVLWSVFGSGSDKYLGDSLANVGDVDGDGVDDVGGSMDCVVPYTNQNDIGRAFVWSGASGAVIHQWQGGREFGGAIGAAGDANGDGTPDIAVGAPMERQGSQVQEGVVRVYSGTTGALLWDWQSNQDLDQAGRSLDTIGDFNQDGSDDLLVGAGFGDSVYLLSGVDGSKLHVSLGTVGGPYFGARVEGIGDHDNDGELDVLIGASRETVNSETRGAVYVASFAPFLSANGTTVSASAGGTVTLDLDFPAETANGNLPLGNISHDYALLASASGTGPTTFSGWTIPLTADGLYASTKAGSYPAQVSAGRGPLSLDGDATVTITFAPGAASGLVGRSFFLCALHYEYGSPWPTIVHGPSLPATMTITP